MLAQRLAGEADPALARMGRLAGEILADPTRACGRNCTWYIGDMIIALELPQDVALYTTNRRHFALLLAILGNDWRRRKLLILSLLDRQAAG